MTFARASGFTPLSHSLTQIASVSASSPVFNSLLISISAEVKIVSAKWLFMFHIIAHLTENQTVNAQKCSVLASVFPHLSSFTISCVNDSRKFTKTVLTFHGFSSRVYFFRNSPPLPTFWKYFLRADCCLSTVSLRFPPKGFLSREREREWERERQDKRKRERKGREKRHGGRLTSLASHSSTHLIGRQAGSFRLAGPRAGMQNP